MPDLTQIVPRPAPREVEFRDREAAERNLSQIRQQVPAAVYNALEPLLAALPDPDAAVTQFCRLTESPSPDLLRLLEKHLFLVHYAVVLFSYSPWLGETLIHNPDLFQLFLGEKSLDRNRSREQFQESLARMRSRSLENDLAALLTRFKKREYVRITLRDVLGIATLAETTQEISALSDVLIEAALRETQTALQSRFGMPLVLDANGRVREARFAILSLGKLGGDELNYSSDIDLLFLYDSGPEAPGAAVSSREYFIRLAQQVTELLARHSREGPAFRIDLRLRPQGTEGEPAVPLAHAVAYYSHVAHDWELQAMIKARHSAGDIALARELVRALQPRVYRPELNFAAIKTALQTREKMSSHRRQRLVRQATAGGIDVKLDPGGIRDIEFLVQCLQRVYGGGESWLRSRGTLFALQKLFDKEHIGSKDFHNLTNAYEFLRTVEHRLQLRHGQQTHCVPSDRAELKMLAHSLVREGTAVQSPEEFLSHLRRRMAAVAEIYQRVVFQEQNHSRQEAPAFQLRSQAPASPENSFNLMLQRLALDAPHLREAVGRAELSPHARSNLDRFLSSAGTTSDRYGAVLRSPAAVEKALTIFEYSEFLADILVRHPAEVQLLDQIAEPSSDAEPAFFGETSSHDGAKADPVSQYLAQDKVERAEAMSILRRDHRSRIFHSGARDLFQLRPVFDSLADSTAAADAAIQGALAMSGAPAGFAVMGLGRLGSREFDLLSDADVLFVCDEAADSPAARRAAELLVEALTAYTHDGSVFPVDARLRPHGREGELVVTPVQLAAYFQDEAKPWEALTYLKLRFVAGDTAVAARALQVSQHGIQQLARKPTFMEELHELRTRLEKSESGPSFKTGAGGSYDLDYLAGMLQIQHQAFLAANLVSRLQLLRRRQALSEDEYCALEESAIFLRTLEHLVRLVTGRARKWFPSAEHPHRSVQKLLWRMLGADDSFDPEMRLAELMQQNRDIYLRHR